MNSSGDIGIIDALMTAQYYVGLNPQPFDVSVADVSGDGAINIIDALQIAQYYVGLISSFAGCQAEPTPTPTIGPSTGPTEISDVPHGYGRNATGGGNASPQTVSSASAFKSAVSGSGAAVIIVNGKLNVGTVSIGSNKTIIGANSSSGLYGGVIKVGGNNYIFKNLIIGPYSGDDAMEISGATNVFIHKVTFVDGADGNCDIVRGSDNVTLSYCRFYYTTNHDHRFVILIGNSDGATGDRGKLHVTIHHSWFDDGCIERMPRVRYGHVHLYNNLYSSNTNNYCIGIGVESQVRVENSVFVDQKQIWFDWGGNDFGWSNLKLEGSTSQPSWISNSFPVFDPPYSYKVDSVDNVKSIVMANAGID